MGPLVIMLTTAAAGASLGAAASHGLGATGLILGLNALLAASAAGSLAAAAIATRSRSSVEARFETLAHEMVLIRQRQVEADLKLDEVERRAQDSPALVWRAATSDIQVLGSLVSDLAKAVAEHDARLAGGTASAPAGPPQRSHQDAAMAEDDGAFVLPRTSPPPASWFEDEAAAGRTPAIEEPALEPEHATPPSAEPALLAELRATLAEALAGDRIEICLQPYVTLPQRKVAGYEASLALKTGDGEPRDPGNLAAAARACGMSAELDKLLIERAGQVMRVLRARERSVPISCAVSAASLADARFRSAVEMVARTEGKLAENLLLSVAADEAGALMDGSGDALDSLRRTGVALGVRARVASGLDLTTLERFKARQLKLPAAVLVGASPTSIQRISPKCWSAGESASSSPISTTRRQCGICWIAPRPMGRARSSAQAARCARRSLQPRPVTEQRAAQRVEAARAARAEAPAPQRQSFRSLLRRA